MDINNRNLIIASNLFRLSALLMAITYILLRVKTGGYAEFLAIALTIFIAYIIRKGYKWIKWVLLVLYGITIPFFIIGLFVNKSNLSSILPNIGINILQIIALVYLFLPYKSSEYSEVEIEGNLD